MGVRFASERALATASAAAITAKSGFFAMTPTTAAMVDKRVVVPSANLKTLPENVSSFST